MPSKDAELEAEFRSPLDRKNLLFLRMHAREELGRLPEYRIDLLRPNDDPKVKALEAKELLGKAAGVDIRLTADGSFRQINGLVTRFEKGGVRGRYDLYHVELRPWLWHLTLGADCRIFQNKSALEIITSIFDEYKSATAVEDKVSPKPAKRPFTVQYRESDYNFVSRLMEEEGIYYYFKHANEQHTLVLCNNPSGHSNVEGGMLHWSSKKSDRLKANNIITQWTRSHSLRSLKYSLTDFAAESPATSLLASAKRDAHYGEPNDLEVYDYPGGHDDMAMGTNTGTKKAEGERKAKLRVDAFESGHSVAAGITAFRPLAVGHTFKFENPPVDADKLDYLVTSSIFEMEVGGYEADKDKKTLTATNYTCRFDAVPKAVPFRPSRAARAPLVHGPQTATVVGPSGDEIHTDKYGRVKVKFHWDRGDKKNETSSCFVRISQPWASKQFGMMALPRIGDEVVVEFLEGNPDRPLITGRVYNGTNLPPWDLPAHATVSGIKTRSSKGGAADNANELRFEDEKGKEYVWLQAEKDFHRWVKNDSFDTVNRDRWTDTDRHSQHNVTGKYAMEVGKTATLKITEDVSAKLGADFSHEVTGALGAKIDDAIAVKGAKAIALTAGAALDVDAGQTIKITGGSSVHIKGLGIVIDGGTSLTIKAGSGSVVLDGGGVSITGALVKINSGGSPGTASAAAEASPAAPVEPEEPAENKDPLAS
jgi:type VI secretion system secreted protein VgrG